MLYDRDCGFCRASLRRVLAWDRRDRLRPVALQDEEAERLLGEMSQERRMASWHLVTEDGQRYSAGRAAAPLLRLLPGGGPLARLADAFPSATDAGYEFVAGHRGALSRLTKLLRR
ncbi:MAG TPA: DCC1-like thiol-disulfide oxidoreductase family protein [Solirubrobacteraceae bacterium]